jgi:hypothetical protein
LGKFALYQHGLLTPVVALILWSLVVWVWLYVTRIPGMRKAKVRPQEGAYARELNTKMPPWARSVADNYNHLMEQPTIFYATCFVLQFLDQTHPINIGLAWTYVVLRIAHTLVQATFNNVLLRFTLFTLSTLVLMALALHAAIGVGMIQFDFTHGE